MHARILMAIFYYIIPSSKKYIVHVWRTRRTAALGASATIHLRRRAVSLSERRRSPLRPTTTTCLPARGNLFHSCGGGGGTYWWRCAQLQLSALPNVQNITGSSNVRSSSGVAAQPFRVPCDPPRPVFFVFRSYPVLCVT